MCGIAGFFGIPDTAVPARALLGRMISAIAHRGPDDQGYFVDDGVGFGHARLSIIDVANGQQPMTSADGTIVVTFNGQIFNYVELRRDLIARGAKFRTNSDTEVILHAYEAMGVDCVTAFNGDFAFAIYDKRQKRLMLARDRMGIRPLYYAWRRGCLYFASEVKALLRAPGVDAELDPIALDQTFTFWFPLTPRTAFKDVSELPPAHVMVVTADRVTIKPYWKLEYPDASDPGAVDRRGEGDISEEIRSIFLDATRIRLRSEVPVGAYLSGGLDSSIIAATIKQIVPERLRTFSVTFEAEEFDESAYQLEMVRALGTEHTSVACRTADIGRMFPDVMRHAEQPILRTAPAPLFALANLVHSSGYKVVLTGEGADEVFGGYDIFKEAKIRRFCARNPASAWRPLLFKRLYPYLPALKSQSQTYREAFFGMGLDETSDPLFSHLPRFRTTIGAKAFLSEEMRETIGDYDAIDELRAGLPREFTRWHPLSQAQYLETRYLLPNYILAAQGDRVAMAHAVEGRFPFLDHRVVELAAKIPPSLKIRGLREKHILRSAMKDILPGTIGNRTKQPYRAPDSQSFVGTNAPDYVGARLGSREIGDVGYFEPRAVEKLHAKVKTQRFVGFRDNMAFVGILSTQLWQHEFARGGAARPAATKSAIAIPAIA